MNVLFLMVGCMCFISSIGFAKETFSNTETGPAIVAFSIASSCLFVAIVCFNRVFEWCVI